jgi:hypothetical protein
MMALASQFAVAGPAEKPKSPPQSVKELVERIKLLEGSHEVGNGGGGFLCLDPVSGRIRDLLVLDLIEGQVADRLVYDKSRQLPLDLQISRAVSRLNLVDPALGVKLKRWLSILPAGKATLIGLTKSAPVSDFSPRVDVNPQDFSEYGCTFGLNPDYRNFVVFIDTKQNGMNTPTKVIWDAEVDRFLEGRLLERAALLVHEALYRIFREAPYHHADSDRVRPIVAALLSDEVGETDLGDLVRKAKAHKRNKYQ